MKNLKPVKLATVQAVIDQYPGYPSRTIARFVVQKHPGLYRTVEEARAAVRTMRGANGSYRRKVHGKVREHGSHSDGHYPLPEPLEDTNHGWKVVRIKFNTALFLSDIHFPFHDPIALNLALDRGEREKVDTVYLNGDIADFYRISTHDQDPLRRFRLADEIEMVKAFLEHLRDRFPKAQIIYKEGNHEERLARNVWRDCPQLAGVMNPDGTPCVELPSLLAFSEFGITHIGNKQPSLLGEHLYALHGHEFGLPLDRSVNPARGLFQRALCNAICGDVHATHQHTEPSIEKTSSTWTVGCLCKLRPHYRPINRWNQGFALIHNNKGDWSVQNHKILNGKVV
jgi:predicted phosphodiesterase